MKDLVRTDETFGPGVKLGIVRLGRCAGKMKYTLLDERDITLAREHLFEARLEIDRNGNGAQIYAYAFHLNTKGTRCGARYLHELVWERHYGGMAPGYVISHKNAISMDNRLENLCLMPLATYNPYLDVERTTLTTSQSAQSSVAAASSTSQSSPVKPIEHSLYWAAIQQLPPEHLIDEIPDGSSTSKCFDANGDLVEDEDEITCYFECHYPPCIRMEREPREFSICGRCQEARYCGPSCQQRDWPVHKKFCREKVRAPRIANLGAIIAKKFPQPER
jgi:hypothetical protein